MLKCIAREMLSPSCPMKLKLLFDFKIKTLLHYTCLFSVFFLFRIKRKIAMDVKAVTDSTASLWLPWLTGGKS